MDPCGLSHAPSFSALRGLHIPILLMIKIEGQKPLKQLGQHLVATECLCLGLTHSPLSFAWQCEEHAYLCHSCRQEIREVCDGVFVFCSELLFHVHLQVVRFLFSPREIIVQCVLITIKSVKTIKKQERRIG